MAAGSCHSAEGIKLEELCLKAGDAKLLVRGNLLGARQKATLLLTDFPLAVLQPVYRAMPALRHAAPAVGASPPAGGVPNSKDSNPFSGISMPFVRGSRPGAEKSPGYDMYASSPVNGLLYIRGSLGELQLLAKCCLRAAHDVCPLARDRSV